MIYTKEVENMCPVAKGAKMCIRDSLDIWSVSKPQVAVFPVYIISRFMDSDNHHAGYLLYVCQKDVYKRQSVKPPHLTLDLELLKESTINTRIGRYRNKKISPIYTPVSYTHLY